MKQLSALHYINPTEATLFLTNKCNFLCEDCKRQIQGVNDHADMTLETVKRLLAIYPLINGVCIAGLGEPTLCSEFANIVDYLIKSVKYVGIVSNGSNAESIIGLDRYPNYVSISLYGYDRDSYIKTVKLDTYDTVIKNFSLMRSNLSNIGFSYFINKNNYKQLSKIINIAKEADADFLHITNYLAYDVFDKDELDNIITLNDKDIITEIDGLLSTLKLPGARPVYVDVDKYVFNCPSYRTIINVNGAGDVSACQRQIAPSSEFGNIFDDKDWYNEGRIQECRTKIESGQYPHENCKYCFGKMGNSKGDDLSIGIFILFHEKVEQTIECINSFLPFGISIYILNNGSSSQSTSKLLAHIKNYKHVILLDTEHNLGVGVGRNYLIEHTKEEWLFFIDNDIIIHSTNIVDKILNHIIQYPDAEAFIPSLYNVHENSFVNFLIMNIDNNIVRFKEISDESTNYFPGGAAVVNRKVFQRCGLYDEKMFIGLEDMELALRAIFAGEPINCRVIKDITLHHNHKTVTACDDKRAVITRYDMGIQEKSYLRILQKYPTLKFDHSYHSWVVEQQTIMTQSNNFDLTLLTPLKNFGSGTLKRFKIDIFQYYLESELVVELIKTIAEWYPGLHVVQFVGSGIYAEEIQNSFPLASFYDSYSTQKSNISASIDPESYIELEKWERTILSNSQSPLIVINILERLIDPRPFLYTLRNLLFAGCKCILVVDGQDTSSGKVTQGSYWRQWNYNEIHKLLVSAGFTISKQSQSNYSIGYSFIEIQVADADYEIFLNSLYLPSPSIEYLIVSQEHSAAAITGGIGSYVGELEKVFPVGLLGLMLIGSGDLLPDHYRCKQSKYFHLSQFLGDLVGNLLLEDAVSLALDVIIFLYKNLKVVEFQDVNGKGFKFIQGEYSGLYPTKLMTQVVCHASRISLEKTYQIWIDPNDRELFEEKYVIEKADVVKFPTQYIRNYYRQVGYSICDSHARYERLPFLYEYDITCQHKFVNLDTLIFFGKRNSYKGFDVFTRVVRKLIESGRNVRRVMLVGPRCDDMIECNSYFDEIAAHGITVEEHSLKRSDALNLIEANANRSICVIPYLADNHPYSVLEIINAYCPFVATSTGGIPELIPALYSRDVLCRTDPEKLVDCIERWWLRTPTERKKLVEKLRDAAIHDQSLINDNIYRNLMDVYANWRERKRKNIITSENHEVTCLVVADSNNDGLYSILHMIRQQTQPPDQVMVLQRRSSSEKELNEAAEILNSIDDSRYQILLLDSECDGELLNEGLLHVTTNFLATFHVSIVISNTCIASYLRQMESDPTCDYVTSYSGHCLNLNNESLFPEQVYSYLGEGTFISQVNNLLGHPYGLYRTKSLRQCGGFVCSDEFSRGGWSTIMRLVSRGYKVGVIPRPEVCVSFKKELYGDNYSDQHLLAIETFGVGRFESFRLQATARWLSLKKNITSQNTDSKLLAEYNDQLNYIHELEGLINGYTNSLSWKLTRPLRFGKRLIKKVVRSVQSCFY